MNFFNEFKDHILGAVNALVREGSLPEGLDLSRITTEPPRDIAHGDIATNAAMVLAKPAGKNPRELAEKLCEKLNEISDIEEASVAGPGFVNLRLKASYWPQHLRHILTVGSDYGSSKRGAGEKINLEYVSANPTGPIHAGHGRVAIVADALGTLLEKVGFEVLREYYINDAGGQAQKLAHSTHLRYREALGEDIGEIPEGYYPGEYLKDVGEAIAKADGDKWLKHDDWFDYFRAFAVDAMMERIKHDLALMGIKHHVFSSEMDLQRSGAIDRVVAELESKGLVYTGVLEAPKGKVIDDWEPRPQMLFRATQFGDDVDRPLKKSDGTWTYFTADIAYHLDKVVRGYTNMIDVWGADHGGYVKRIQAAVKAITDGKGTLDVILAQIVNFTENGQPVRMSKRAGTFIEVRDVIEKVGRDVFRFMMISRKSDAHLDFDFVKVMEQSKDNPVFYVNYAHARCHSVMKMAHQQFPHLDLSPMRMQNASLDRLIDEDELTLIKLLAGWPRQVEIAALSHEPHRLCTYLCDVAAQFHMVWNKGKENTILRFIVPDDEALTLARMALIQGVAFVIVSGLNIFGVEPLKEMRE